MVSAEKEKRGFIRIPFSTETRIEAGGRSLRSNGLIDVSMSGMRLTTDDVPPLPGTVCQVMIILQASANRIIIEASGKILRAEQGTIAVEFIELEVDSYNHLRQIILNNTDDPEKAERELAAHRGIRQLHH